MRWPFDYDCSDVLFRILFNSIFQGLGAER